MKAEIATNCVLARTTVDLSYGSDRKDASIIALRDVPGILLLKYSPAKWMFCLFGVCNLRYVVVTRLEPDINWFWPAVQRPKSIPNPGHPAGM